MKDTAASRRAFSFVAILWLLIGSVTAIDYTLTDQASPSLYNLTNINATYNTSGYWNFDGLTSWMSPKNNAALNLTTAFTLSSWIYPYSFPANSYVMGRGRGGSDAAGLNIQYGIYLTTNNVNCGFENASGTDFAVSTVAPSAPMHVVCTWNGVNVTMYINGRFNKTTAAVAAVPEFSASNFSIGANTLGATGLSHFFNGTIDDARVISTGVTGLQAAALFNNQSVACSTLAAWYPGTNASEVCVNPCVYVGSGNWTTYGYEACSISTNTDIIKNTILYPGNGSATITANLTNFTNVIASGNVTVTFSGGGGLR